MTLAWQATGDKARRQTESSFWRLFREPLSVVSALITIGAFVASSIPDIRDWWSDLPPWVQLTVVGSTAALAFIVVARSKLAISRLQGKLNSALDSLEESKVKVAELSQQLGNPSPHDRRLFRDVVDELGSDSRAIRFLRDHDHRLAFDLEIMQPLDDFVVTYGAVENRFHDAVMAEKTSVFRDRAIAYMEAMGSRTAPSQRPTACA